MIWLKRRAFLAVLGGAAWPVASVTGVL